MMRFGSLTTVALCLATTLVWAHGKATGIVRERMDQMVVLKEAMKRLKTELSKGKVYDSALVLAATQEIADHSGQAMLIKFPEGSLTKHSEALQSVWDEPDRFADLARQMEKLAGEMTASVESEVPNVEAGSGLLGWLNADSSDAEQVALRSPIDTLGKIAKTCKECHEGFRKD